MMETILKLIEEVDPKDMAKLDEIDFSIGKLLGKDPYHNGLVKYTRSRDALKAIRPEGVNISICNFNGYYPTDKWTCYLTSTKSGNEYQAKGLELPSEELAELHAIIQAIAHEKENK
jgi:hypothetical protein